MPIMTNEGIKVRICAGMLVSFYDGLLSNSRTDFNYKILVCYGTLIDQFKIKVLNLETGLKEMIAL